MNRAQARREQVETSLGQDLNNILLDLSRAGPFGLLRVWCERRHYRNALARLLIIGPYMINDIGLTTDQAMAEMDQPFWRGSDRNLAPGNGPKPISQQVARGAPVAGR